VKQPYYVLVSGLKGKPEVRVGGKVVECEYEEGRAVVKVNGSASVEILMER
jgi:hypothetical protein